ncbi:hypothetical protein [Sporomusa aerivorans]|uniref:hypothetical protein n=1 Tax=Sporomusa aerivorans TaxID=204936 RepID=UPI00352BCCDB
MSLKKFLISALIVFLAGVAILYSGANRAPFRQHNPNGPHPQTHSAAPLSAGTNYLA